MFRKGQRSWNISVTKEARMDPKVVLESSTKCLFRGIFFFTVKKSLKQTNKLQNDTSSSLIGYKTGRAHYRALNSSSFACLVLSFPPLSSPPLSFFISTTQAKYPLIKDFFQCLCNKKRYTLPEPKTQGIWLIFFCS